MAQGIRGAFASVFSAGVAANSGFLLYDLRWNLYLTFDLTPKNVPVTDFSGTRIIIRTLTVLDPTYVNTLGTYLQGVVIDLSNKVDSAGVTHGVGSYFFPSQWWYSRTAFRLDCYIHDTQNPPRFQDTNLPGILWTPDAATQSSLGLAQPPALPTLVNAALYFASNPWPNGLAYQGSVTMLATVPVGQPISVSPDPFPSGTQIIVSPPNVPGGPWPFDVFWTDQPGPNVGACYSYGVAGQTDNVTILGSSSGVPWMGLGALPVGTHYIVIGYQQRSKGCSRSPNYIWSPALKVVVT